MYESDPCPEFSERVRRLAGSRPVRWTTVSGGCTVARRCVVHFENGASAFLEAATDPDTDAWLRAEHRVYSQLRQPFLPRLLGWDEEGEWPLMLLEDFSLKQLRTALPWAARLLCLPEPG